MPNKSDSIILNYTEAGDPKNPSLVFLHFFGGSSQTWNGVVTELSSTYHCITVDLCGWGDSFDPVHPLSLEDNARQVIKLINSVNLANYVLIGHSMGGKIALAVAAQKLPGLKSLILIAPSPPTPEPMSEQARKDLKNAFGNRIAIEKVVRKLTKKTIMEQSFTEIVKDHLRASHLAWTSWLEKGSKEDISATMSAISIPILVISGSKDPVFATSFLRTEFAKYFPSARFEEIKNAGHLIPVQASSETARLIEEFLNK